jgi:Peptidase A4 family
VTAPARRWWPLALLGAGVLVAGSSAVLTARQHTGAAAPPPVHQVRSVSPNWVGYTFSVLGVTGIRAEWSEPVAFPVRQRSAEVVWVGVGGFNSPDIMQAGTIAYFTGRYGDENAWYERFPLDKHTVPGLRVFPQDVIDCVLTRQPGSRARWRIWIKETATGAIWTRTVEFDARVQLPDFIVEDPARGRGGALETLAHWGSVTFSHMAIRVGGAWVAPGHFSSIRIDMTRGGRTIASAGGLRAGGTSFTATQR